MHILVLCTIKNSLSLFCVARPFAQLCDYETWLLSTYNTELGVPIGLERLSHEHWVQHVQRDLPKSEWTWEQYTAHVLANQGDDWFLEPLEPAP